jgi:hypothetical protein
MDTLQGRNAGPAGMSVSLSASRLYQNPILYPMPILQPPPLQSFILDPSSTSPCLLIGQKRCPQSLFVPSPLLHIQRLQSETSRPFVPPSLSSHLRLFNVVISLHHVLAHIIRLMLQKSNIRFQNFHHTCLNQVLPIHKIPHHASVPSLCPIHVHTIIGPQIYLCYQI